jgi:hypothetical protein
MIPLVAMQARAATPGTPGRPGAGSRARPGRGDANCLLSGTAVLTDRGPIAIEHLQSGDLVLTAAGALKPIARIDSSLTTREAGAQWDENIAPVRIAQSAISPGVPARELYLSPEHALFIDGFLIPVKCLVNGLTITQDLSARERVDYFHLAFERHEVFYAEGTAVESLRVGSTGEVLTPYAPQLGYHGGRQEAVALARIAVYPWIDVRDRIQIIYDRLVERAKLMQAGAVSALAA